MRKFPDNFFWGASTSAHQVEGGNHNDWTEWEKENAARLAKEALNKSYPDHVLNDYPGPLRRENYISGKACDHYNRFEKDFDIAKSLGHNAHRFSIEWSRIEPEEGEFDEREIEHYRKVIRALRERGIEPFVTLWHWAFPLWVRDIGGFENKKTVDFFCRYAERMTKEFGQDIGFWLTINEPMVYAGNSYFREIWPPQKSSLLSYIKVLKNLESAHKRIYKIIKKTNPLSQVGIAKNGIYFEAGGLNKLLANAADWWWNERFLDNIREEQDFIGLNYYFYNRVKGLRFNQNENKDISDMGREVYPEGIYKVLRNLAKYKKPIYVTENGLADAKDEHRADFIKEHLKWVERAIKGKMGNRTMGEGAIKGKMGNRIMGEGAIREEKDVDVRGYFYWSLLDNFEWDKGFWPRFGLVEIDYKTLERKIRPSAFEYKKIISQGL